MGKLENKTVVITGGNSGIGYETAKEFIAQGARVIFTGRNKEAVEKAALKLGDNAIGLVSDASNMEHIKSFESDLENKGINTIDILFYNEGIGQSK